MKGSASAEAVLCTDSNTFALRMVETTNSLLLAPANQVISKESSFWEHLLRDRH